MAAHGRGELKRARHDCVAALRLFSGTGYDVDVANVLLELSAIEHALGRYAESLQHARKALALLALFRDDHVDLVRLRVRAHSAIGNESIALARFADARRSIMRALTLATNELPEHERLRPLNQLGIVCKYTGRYAEAARAYRVAVRIATRRKNRAAMATLLHNQGGLAHARRRWKEAETYARKGLALRRRLRGRSHVEVAADAGALAVILDDSGKPREAIALYREALRTFTRALGSRHFEVGFALANLAALHHSMRRWTLAERTYARALAILRRALGPRHAEVERVTANARRLADDRGDLKGARRPPRPRRA